jgi:uncharacterized protein
MNPNFNRQQPGPDPYGHDERGHQQQQWAARAAAQQGMQMPAHYGGQINPAAQQQFMTKVFGWMTMGLGLSGFAAWYTFSSGLIYALAPQMWILSLVTLGLVFGLSMMVNKMPPIVATGAFLLYATLNGVTLSVIFAAYTLGSIAQTFLVTTMTFGFMFVYGWVTKKDLTAMGSLLFMGLIGLIIAMVVNLFIGSGTLSLIISAVGVLIFVGLTAYDAQKIKEMSAYGFADSDTEQRGAVMGALVLYLDFINLFLMLLRFLGDRR